MTSEFGLLHRPHSLTSEEELTSISPSAILSQDHPQATLQYNTVIRMSRGHPAFAKPVGIPVVPTLGKKPERTAPGNRVNGVRPEQINNFVNESEHNRLVMDFGDINLNQVSLCANSFEGLLGNVHVA